MSLFSLGFFFFFSFLSFVIMFIQPYDTLILKRTVAKFPQCSVPARGLYVLLHLLTRQINGAFFQVIIS